MMKKYAAWMLRASGVSMEICDSDVLQSIRHMIKCTSVRRCVCKNVQQYVIVREAEADIIGRPVFTVMNDKGVVGIAFPATKADCGDYSIIEQFVDSFKHTNVMPHVATAKRRAALHDMKQRSKHKPSPAKHRPGIARDKEVAEHPITQVPKPSIGAKGDEDGTMVISLVGNFSVMQGLIGSVSALARGHPVQMSVINAV
jgi:hypothetical protein